jgi:hypothetical protein
MSRDRAEHAGWLIGGAGVIATLVGWLTAPGEFPHAWLAAWTCWIAWPLGSMALVLIHALTGGRWGMTLRGPLAAGIAALPLIVVAGAPLLLVGPQLYPWMDPQVAAGLHNRFYLNVPFFEARTVVYLGVWLALSLKVLAALRQDRSESRLARIAPAGLILLALTVTFAAIDYTLSLEPNFQSSIYGWMVGSEAILFALSIAILAVTLASRACAGPLSDLARLLLALLVFWAYLDFMQMLIAWNSNLPHEALWYRPRLDGAWGKIAGCVAVGHFALPFLALIWPQVQRSRRGLGTIALFLVSMEIPRAWWIVVPAAGRQLGWVDGAAMIAMLGLVAGATLRTWRRTRLEAGAHV